SPSFESLPFKRRLLLPSYKEETITPIDLREMYGQRRLAPFHELPIRRDGGLHDVHESVPYQRVRVLPSSEDAVRRLESFLLQEARRDRTNHRTIECRMPGYHDANCHVQM